MLKFNNNRSLFQVSLCGYLFSPSFISMLATFFFILIFVKLGFWQLSRSHEKQAILDEYASHETQAPLSLYDVMHVYGSGTTDLRYRRLEIKGFFDNAHPLLLDNQIRKGVAGYELLLPFKSELSDKYVLVDVGWLVMPQYRDQLPDVAAMVGSYHFVSMIDFPQTWSFLSTPEQDFQPIRWPKRIQKINIDHLKSMTSQDYFPFILVPSVDSKVFDGLDALPPDRHIINIIPAKHLGYAVQWFAFAVTLFIIFISVNTKKEV